ncbi:MAG: erythromycin esterase family protein [Gammaproteobacteria bacterium]
MRRLDFNPELVSAIERDAIPLADRMEDFTPVVAAARGKQYVLIGEASHGTREFYRARAQITERLLAEEGFDAVAVEADWPDAYRVNRYVMQQGTDPDADQALGNFERFPRWMWRNHEVKRFIEWLHAYNASAEEREPAGFYGLDLYSLNSSVHAVIDYLNHVDPSAAQRARMRYGCLWHFMEEPQRYGYAAQSGLVDSCEAEIVTQLRELLESRQAYLARDGYVAEDEYFCAAQNAKVVKGAEEYYRALYRGRPNTWNLRDRHMFDTLEAISAHLGRNLGRAARIVVWAHNSHVGNAGATEMGERGETNIGQLVREHYGEQALLVGFSTCRGRVMAASDWDMPPEIKRIREPWAGSYEEVFHHVNYKTFLLDLRQRNAAVDMLAEARLQRAIGVIYRPGTERYSHYFHSRLPEQFDFMLHYDDTEALSALDTTIHGRYGELDETWPRGL